MINNNKSSELNTYLLEEEVGKCEDLEELKEVVFPKILSQQEEWSRKVNEILEETGFTKTKFADLCGVTRETVYKWCKGAIPTREKFLRIGLAAGYSVERMNQLLQRYGRYPGLYSKSLEDCVCIFVINHGYGEDAIEKYYFILDKIKANINRDDAEEVENITTEKFDAKLSEVYEEAELEQFIADNIAMFSNAYHRLYAYVLMNIEVNYMEKDNIDNISAMAELQEWSSSLKQCVSAIRQNKWYPTRNKIISLGLHLSMDREQVNEMLELAHMEPLCAKNIFESIIIYILEYASINDMLNAESDEFDVDGLIGFAREVFDSLQLPEVEDFISELPEVY